jgi:hypothetical protein
MSIFTATAADDNSHSAPKAGGLMSDMHISTWAGLGRLLLAMRSAPRAADVVSVVTEFLAHEPDCQVASYFAWSDAHQALVAPPMDGLANRVDDELTGVCAIRRESCAGPGQYVVPVVATDRALLGVLDVRAKNPTMPVAPHLVESTEALAQLLALSLESLATLQRSRECQVLLQGAECLAKAADGTLSASDTLRSLIALGPGSTRARVCALYLAGARPDGLELVVASSTAVSLPPRLDYASGNVRSGAIGDCFGQLHVTASVPVGVGTEQFGVLLALDERRDVDPRHARDALEHLARLAALALRQARLVDLAVEHTRPVDLLWDLLHPTRDDPAITLARARRLGCDLNEPRVVLVVEAGDILSSDRAGRTILELDRVGLVDTSGCRTTAIVRARVLDLLSFEGLSVGVSRPCTRIERYPEALGEAREALELGCQLWGRGRVTTFEMLGSYRFVSALAHSGLTDDADYQQLSRLSDELLRTLEAYLDSGGNTAEAARQLFLHRNTLRQRLDRIAGSVDFAAPSRWLSLLMAVKVARIERLRTAPATRMESSSAPIRLQRSAVTALSGTRGRRDWQSA